MVMTIIDESTKVHFRKENVTKDLDGMKREVEALRQLHKTRKATMPFGLSSVIERDTWDDWTPAEWDEWLANGGEQQVAEEPAAKESLNAVGK